MYSSQLSSIGTNPHAKQNVAIRELKTRYMRLDVLLLKEQSSYSISLIWTQGNVLICTHFIYAA
jgi:hypothetical protein